MESVFAEASTRLEKAGLSRGQITTRLAKGVRSRAGAIIEEALKGGYGTIVVGRRGISYVEEFSMGRVSNKIIHLAKELAVWVVS
jgi:nucleotide-binding universal stress UspA family protein